MTFVFSVRPWTLEEDAELERLYELEGACWQKIAIKMERNRFQVQLHHSRVLRGEKPAQHSENTAQHVMYIKDDQCRELVYGM